MAKSTEEDSMARLPWHPRLRQATIARPLVVAGVTLTLAVVAAVGMAATLAPGPNGCPTNKSLKTAPIADLAPPARTQIEAFDVLSGPINEGIQTFTMKVRVGSTSSRATPSSDGRRDGASVAACPRTLAAVGEERMRAGTADAAFLSAD